MKIGILTDLHIEDGGVPVRGIDTKARVARAVDRLAAERPDIVLCLGDVVNSGERGDPASIARQYDEAAALLSGLTMPLVVIPGNHDARDGFRTAFRDHLRHPGPVGGADGGADGGGGGFLCQAVDLGDLRVLALDSMDAGKVDGRLCEARLDWTERELAASGGRPVIVVLHHPPFFHDEEVNNLAAFGGRDRLEALITGTPNVIAVAAGHWHHAMSTRWADTLALAVPSVSFQLRFREPGGEKRDGHTIFTSKDQGFYQLWHWDGGRLHAYQFAVPDGPDTTDAAGGLASGKAVSV